MCHRIPGVPKRTHLSWASQGSYIAYSKLHMLALTSFVSPVWYTAIHELSLLPFVAPPPKKKKNFISRPSGQLHTKFKAGHTLYCFILILGQKLDKSIDFHSCQDLLPRNCFFDIQGSWTAKYMIQICTYSILPYLSPTIKKIGKFIFARVCSPEIQFLVNPLSLSVGLRVVGGG